MTAYEPWSIHYEMIDFWKLTYNFFAPSQKTMKGNPYLHKNNLLAVFWYHEAFCKIWTLWHYFKVPQPGIAYFAIMAYSKYVIFNYPLCFNSIIYKHTVVIFLYYFKIKGVNLLISTIENCRLLEHVIWNCSHVDRLFYNFRKSRFVSYLQDTFRMNIYHFYYYFIEYSI